MVRHTSVSRLTQGLRGSLPNFTNPVRRNFFRFPVEEEDVFFIFISYLIRGEHQAMPHDFPEGQKENLLRSNICSIFLFYFPING